MADENYFCGFNSIHPPSIVRFDQDAGPPSPLSSTPNTPLRLFPSEQNKNSSAKAPLDLDLPPLLAPVATPTNTINNRKVETPFDETDEENSPKNGKSLASPARASKTKTAASPPKTPTKSPPKTPTKSTTLPGVTMKRSSPEMTPTNPITDPLLSNGTPSTLRMLALLQNEGTKSSNSQTGKYTPTTTDMKTTRQFDKSFVPTIVAPVAKTIDGPEGKESPERSMRLEVPHDESPTSRREQNLPNQVAHSGIPVSTGNEMKDDDSYTPEFQPPAKPDMKNKSVLSDVLLRDQGSFEATTEEEEVDVINLMMSDAAYYSKAAAEISFSFTSVLADASAAMEELVMGPSKVAKTPEQLAAEWRRRKRIVLNESKTQATNSGTVGLEPEELGEEVEVSSKGVPVGEEEDDDDMTAQADNRVRSDFDSQEEAAVENSLVGIVVGAATVDQPSSVLSKQTSSVKGNGLDAVTGWWLEKEVSRRDQKSTSIESVSSTDSPAPSSVSLRAVDDVSVITEDSDQKRRQMKKKAVAAAVDLAIASSAAPTSNDKRAPLAGRPPLSMKKSDTKAPALKAVPPVETKITAPFVNRRKQKRQLILPAKEEPFILNKNLEGEKKERRNNDLVLKELSSPMVDHAIASVIIPSASSETIHSTMQVDGLGLGPGDNGDLPSLSRRQPEKQAPAVIAALTTTTMSKTTEEVQLEVGSQIGISVVGLASAVVVVDRQSFADPQGSTSNSPLDQASHVEIDPTATQDNIEKSEHEASSILSEILLALEDCSTPPVDCAGDVLALVSRELSETEITPKKLPVELDTPTEESELTPPTEESELTPPREVMENGDKDYCANSSPPLNSGTDAVGVPATAQSAVTLSITPLVDGSSEALSNNLISPSENSHLLNPSMTSPINTFAVVLVPSPLEETTTGVVEAIPTLEETAENGKADEHPKLLTEVAATTTGAVSPGEANPLAVATSTPLSTACGNLPSTPTKAEAHEVTSAPTAETTRSPTAEIAEEEAGKEDHAGTNISTICEERDDRTNRPHLADGALGIAAVACTLRPMLRNETHVDDTPTALPLKSEEVHALTDLPEINDDGAHYVEYEVEDNIVEQEAEHVEVEEDGALPVYQASDGHSVSFMELASVPGQTTSTVESCSSDVTQMRSNETPVLIMSIDDINGVAKGDAVISLVKTSSGTTCSGQVKNAVWRMRMMRRRMASREQGKSCSGEEAHIPGSKSDSPSRKRSSLPVDVDDVRVVGGIRNIESLQAQAIEHLKFDEIEEAQELYEDIIFAYTETFKERVKNDTVENQRAEAALDFRAYIGTALHNLGLLHFLSGDFDDALSFFMRARDSRKALLGENHADYLTSYTKVALCHYALEEFDAAHAEFETALGLGKRNCQGLTDFIQIAEILNNLGVLTFMCGNPGASINHFTESLQVQHAMLNYSLYGGSNIVGNGITLNVSVTRANIGFVKLVSKDFPSALIAFESAFMYQQMLLGDAHETLIGTMDHLAVINSVLGNKVKALKMLSRMYYAQQEAHGASDPRCIATLSKLRLIGSKEKNVVNAVDSMAKTHAPQGMKVASPINLVEQNLASQSASPPRLNLLSPAPVAQKGSPAQSKPKSVLQRFISKRKPKDEVTQPIAPEPCRIEI